MSTRSCANFDTNVNDDSQAIVGDRCKRRFYSFFKYLTKVCEGADNIGLDFDEGNSCSEKGRNEPVPRIIMPANGDTLAETHKTKTSTLVLSLFCISSYSLMCACVHDCCWMTWRRRKCTRDGAKLSWDWLIKLRRRIMAANAKVTTKIIVRHDRETRWYDASLYHVARSSLLPIIFVTKF